MNQTILRSASELPHLPHYLRYTLPPSLQVLADHALSSASSFPSVATSDHPPQSPPTNIQLELATPPLEPATPPLPTEGLGEDREDSSTLKEPAVDSVADLHLPPSAHDLLTPLQAPPPPPTGPPMFTPLKLPEQEGEEPSFSTTLDYTDLETPAGVVAMETKADEEFEFESAPPIPPMSPPELDSVPPLPPSSPPRLSLDEDAMVFIDSYITDAPLHPPPSYPPPPPPMEEGKEEEEGEEEESPYAAVIQPEKPKAKKPEVLEEDIIQPYATVRPMDHIFDAPKRQPLSTLRTLDEEEERAKEEEDEFSALYSKVVKKEQRNRKEPEELEGGDRPLSEHYTKVVKRKQSFEDGDASDRETFQEMVRKASSAGDLTSVNLAEVHDPKRMSMPPESLPNMHMEDMPSFHSSPPLSPFPQLTTFDVTFEEDWKKLQENEKSLEKLQVQPLICMDLPISIVIPPFSLCPVARLWT